MHRLRIPGITAATLAAVLVVSACGSDSKDKAKPAAPPTSAPATSSPAPVAKTDKLAVVKDANLGEIIVDGSGFTLYRFDKDTASPSKSNCAGDCGAKWPASVAAGQPSAVGIDAALVGTLKRPDGAEQVTVAGWPLYRFAADSAAGQTNGQGVGGVWWAVAPTGDKAAAK